ncbi:MAG: pilus assembly protein CpaE [Planctomycetia bacterium]|nr:pilus assembly protein CpaE [Planctomycetia bacterium]
MARVAIVDPSARDREHVRGLMAGMDWAFLETECPHYETALGAIQESNPDGAIVGLDADPAMALQLLGQLNVVLPRLPLIVTSGRPDLLVQAFRLGAKSLLDRPVNLEDLSVALKNLASGISLHRRPHGQVVSFLPSRGGAGTTSLAVNLGCIIARNPTRQPVLLDLDLTAGAAAVALDLQPEFRITDLVHDVEHLDLQSLKRALVKGTHGLSVLARPTRLQDAALLGPPHLQRFLALLRIIFSHILLDLGKGWTPLDMAALQRSDVILLVGQPELVSVHNMTLQVQALSQEGLGDKVRIVMNRVGADYGGEQIELKKAEEVIGRPIYWQLPDEYRAMISAWNGAAPLLQTAPRSKVQQALAALAADLCGDPEAAPAKTAKKTLPFTLVPDHSQPSHE